MIKKEDIEELKKINHVVCITDIGGGYKEGFIYKVRECVSYGSGNCVTVRTEVDSNGDINGWDGKFFRIATHAESEVYGIINNPFHESQVDILMKVNICDREELLIAAAKLRGFIVGARVKDLDSDEREYVLKDNYYRYYKENDDLYCGSDNGVVMIYRQGKWSEVIEEAPKKKTNFPLSKVEFVKVGLKSTTRGKHPGYMVVDDLKSNLPDKWWEKVEVGDTLRCVGMGEGIDSLDRGWGWSKGLEFIVKEVKDTLSKKGKIFFGAKDGYGVFDEYVEPVKCRHLIIRDSHDDINPPSMFTTSAMDEGCFQGIFGASQLLFNSHIMPPIDFGMSNIGKNLGVYGLSSIKMSGFLGNVIKDSNDNIIELPKKKNKKRASKIEVLKSPKIIE